MRFGIETFHLWAGVFMLAGQPKHPGLCPVWLVVLWTMFATLLRGPLAWLSGRYVLSALLGAVFAAPKAHYGLHDRLRRCWSLRGRRTVKRMQMDYGWGYPSMSA